MKTIIFPSLKSINTQEAFAKRFNELFAESENLANRSAEISEELVLLENEFGRIIARLREISGELCLLEGQADLLNEAEKNEIDKLITDSKVALDRFIKNQERGNDDN